MKFEQPPMAEKLNPYEGLDNLSLDDLKSKAKELNLDQLTWLNTKLSQDLESIKDDMKDKGSRNYNMSKEPNAVPLRLDLSDFEESITVLNQKLEIIKNALNKEGENLEIPE